MNLKALQLLARCLVILDTYMCINLTSYVFWGDTLDPDAAKYHLCCDALALAVSGLVFQLVLWVSPSALPLYSAAGSDNLSIAPVTSLHHPAAFLPAGNELQQPNRQRQPSTNRTMPAGSCTLTPV